MFLPRSISCHSLKRNTAFLTHMSSHTSLSLTFRSTFLAWFSYLHLVLHAMVPNSLSSVAFLSVNNFLVATFSLIPRHFLFRSSSPHLCVSGYFNNKCISLSSPARGWHLPFAIHPLATFSIQIPKPELFYATSVFHSSLCYSQKKRR